MTTTRPYRVDLSDQRFGRLTVLSRAEDYVPGNGKKMSQWLCRCDCGAELVVPKSNLYGHTRSCGCLKRASTAARNRTHGMCEAAPAEYYTLHRAKSRCRNPRSRAYKDYGGRGIEYRLPDDLGEATRLLLETIGPRPNGMWIDRIDNDGHYEVGNLRWATPKEQAQNRRARYP